MKSVYLLLYHVINIIGAEKRLRKDLRKTKALLKDAEAVLHKQKSGEGSKTQVRQLRNQVRIHENSLS